MECKWFIWFISMSQNLSVNNFEWIEDIFQFNKDFIKSNNGESNEGCFLKFDIEYPEKLHELYDNLKFLPERMKIEKIKNLVTNLRNKTYVIYIKDLKQVLNHGLVLIITLQSC